MYLFQAYTCVYLFAELYFFSVQVSLGQHIEATGEPTLQLLLREGDETHDIFAK